MRRFEAGDWLFLTCVIRDILQSMYIITVLIKFKNLKKKEKGREEHVFTSVKNMIWL